MLDRWEVLRKYHVTLDVPLIVTAMRCAMAAMIVLALIWALRLRRVGFKPTLREADAGGAADTDGVFH